jgi:hypothetical protein
MQKYFDRDLVSHAPLANRKNCISIEKERIVPENHEVKLSDETIAAIKQTANDILEAKSKGASRILTFGSHLIQNGLGPLLVQFVERGWITHLATIGSSVVDDWEFAYLGKSGEDAKENLPSGCFGTWQEPGFYINLALLVGAWNGLGLGESIGKLIAEESILIPDRKILIKEIRNPLGNQEKIAAAADLLNKIEKYSIPSDRISVPAPYREYSIQYEAYRAGIPFTVHPMFGLDVFYTHPVNSFAAVGRCAQRDFLSFVSSVDNLEDGIYLSVGSSIASPMIFEKALSMSQNVRIPQNRRMERHKIVVVDIAESKWDWMKSGEPPEDRPEYYLRYCKSFSRARAKTMHYISADNRDFFVALYNELNNQ